MVNKDKKLCADEVPAVLVVEDEGALRMLMTGQLEQLGFSVDSAEDGIAAVRLYETNRYCMIFMDIEMPKMNGLQATAAIRSHEKQLHLKPLPIIATTAGGASRELCLTIGMTDYLDKPIDLPKLKRVIEKWTCDLSCVVS